MLLLSTALFAIDIDVVLYKGWNLVAMPCDTRTENIEDVLPIITPAYVYNPVARTYVGFDKFPPANVGFWVMSTIDTFFTVRCSAVNSIYDVAITDMFSSNANVCMGEDVVINVQTETTGFEVLTYEWSINDELIATTTVPTFTWTTPAVVDEERFNVSVNVFDSYDSDEMNIDVNVIDCTPTLNILGVAFDPEIFCADSTEQITINVEYTGEGDLEYLWSFGADGEFLTELPTIEQPLPPVPGFYEEAFVVVREIGSDLCDTLWLPIEVVDCTPRLDIINVAFSTEILCAGETIMITADVDYLGIHDLEYIWIFNEEETITTPVPEVENNLPAVPGIYDDAILVVNEIGGELSDTFAIVIEVVDCTPPAVLEIIEVGFADDSLCMLSTVNVAAVVNYTGEKVLQYNWRFNGEDFTTDAPTIDYVLPGEIGNYGGYLEVTEIDGELVHLFDFRFDVIDCIEFPPTPDR